MTSPASMTILHGSPEPVEIVIERDHKYKSRGKGAGGRALPGCEVCKAGKLDPVHLGAPPSMNGGNHSMDPQAYQALKHAWQAVLAEQLDALGDALPRPCESITVEAVIGFDTFASRDQGNLRWMIEKALGDTLTGGYWKRVDEGKVPEGAVTRASRSKGKVDVEVIRGGWLADDCWWPVRRYVFGGLEGVHTPGQSSTRLLLFPSLQPASRDPRAGEQSSLL